MANVEKAFAEGKPVHVGLDVHKREWTVTVLCQGEDIQDSPLASPLLITLSQDTKWDINSQAALEPLLENDLHFEETFVYSQSSC